jgi:hypothetical protein
MDRLRNWKDGQEITKIATLTPCLTGRIAVTWDSLQVQGRSFEGVTLFKKDPVEIIDRNLANNGNLVF